MKKFNYFIVSFYILNSINIVMAEDRNYPFNSEYHSKDLGNTEINPNTAASINWQCGDCVRQFFSSGKVGNTQGVDKGGNNPNAASF